MSEARGGRRSFGRPSTSAPPLSGRDRKDLRRRGLTPRDARSHSRLLQQPSHRVLVRPCRIGDGVERWRLQDRRRWEAFGRAAARAGRLAVFVPASGAASRMFSTLERLRAASVDGPSAAAFADARSFLARLPELALAGPVAAALRSRGLSLRKLLRTRSYEPILDAILGRGGLADRPKGLLPFHGRPGAARAAFDDHVRAGRRLSADRRGRPLVHFTVSPEHVRAFAARRRGRAGVALSRQSPRTDTLALDPRGGWARDAGGRLLLRPGGHGALLSNLARVSRPFVLLRNIDNIGVDPTEPVGIAWRWAMAGRLAELWSESARWVRALRGRPSVETRRSAARFVRRTLGLRPPSAGGAEWLIDRLNRPWRVCGVVRQRGEPGGGPFWVRNAGEVSKQIVEESEVSAARGQRAVFRRSTHFNPVDMAVTTRPPCGPRRPLIEFADPAAHIVTTKRIAGRSVRILEWPGLWNGGMARWNTVFVEIPSRLFAPVKTVTDLLRPGHRPSH